MVDFVWVVLSYYSDGSAKGRDILLAAFSSQDRADRFKELCDQTCPSRTIEVVCMQMEKS